MPGLPEEGKEGPACLCTSTPTLTPSLGARFPSSMYLRLSPTAPGVLPPFFQKSMKHGLWRLCFEKGMETLF